MECTVCKNEMIILELNKVEIDYCTGCKGIWFDSGELELIFSESERKSIAESFIFTSNRKENKKRCPICKKKMDKIEYKNSGIVIDRCSKNHGLWFDNEELKLLLKLAEDKNSKMIEILKEVFGK